MAGAVRVVATVRLPPQPLTGTAMNERINESENKSAPEEAEIVAVDQKVQSRRRLLKQGTRVAPVLLTLASRPVLAWHCKSPSAWGSEQLNPATSLATNGAHPKYRDETWTISNWRTNTGRAGLGQPWQALGYGDNWSQITLGKLKNQKGIVIPAGVDKSMTVVSFLGAGAGFQQFVAVAQLNSLLLSSLGSGITLSEIKQRATGTYSPQNVSVVWGPSEIVDYLRSNWIVREG